MRLGACRDERELQAVGKSHGWQIPSGDWNEESADKEGELELAGLGEGMRDGEEQHKDPRPPRRGRGWMLGPWTQGLS